MKSAFDRAFSATTLANARNVLVVMPIVCVMILFLTFRAHMQHIPEDNPLYVTLQNGMIVATIGLLIQVGDAMSFRVESNMCGNISQIAGNILVVTGVVILVWGMFVVRLSNDPLSVAGQCLVCVCVLALVVFVATKALQWLLSRTASFFTNDNECSPMIDLLSERKLEDVRSAISFASLLSIAFFYSHFFHYTSGKQMEGKEVISFPSTTENAAMIVAVVTLFCQAIAMTCKVSSNDTLRWMGAVMRGVTVVPMYSAFVVLLYVLLAHGPRSPASWNVLVILMAVAIIRLVIISLQEAASFLLKGFSEEKATDSTSRVLALIKMFQNMSITATLAEILSVLFLYVHFKAQLFLLQDPSKYIHSISYLTPAMYLASIALFVQMTTLLIGFMLEENNLILTIANSVGLTGMVVSLVATMVVALS